MLRRSDQQLDEAKRTEVADEYEADAVAALARGLKKGLRTSVPLDKDATLRPLWGREDFKRLTSSR